MSKNYMQNGKWVHKPSKVDVKICECGNKYIKTRPRQKLCLHCLLGINTR